MLVALSALWLTLFHPRTEGGDLLYLFRLLAGTGMFTSLLLGSMAIRRRDIARHRAWMTRAYALALGCRYPGVHPRHRGARCSSPATAAPPSCRVRAGPINLAVAEWWHPSRPGPSIRPRDRSSAMSRPGRRGQAPARYELRIDGHLDDRWTAWFDDLTLTRESDGTTTLRGLVPDQAALHGLLAKVRDLGATLISVEVIDT